MVSSSGSGIAIEQGPRGDHHPWRAEPALQPVALHEALLHGIELAVDLQPLDRADAAAAAIAASTVHDFTGSPSMSTTQVPQLLVSQPQWVPVSRN